MADYLLRIPGTVSRGHLTDNLSCASVELSQGNIAALDAARTYLRRR